MKPARLLKLAEFVMKEKGPGFNERVYHESLRRMLELQNVRHRSEVTCPVMFLGEIVGSGRADLVIGSLVVEIKANRSPPSDASPQLKGYLDSLQHVEARRYTGVVLNFNQKGGVQMFEYEPPSEVHSRFFRPAKRARADK